MTKQEMLASVEAQIRKDIPRLMELREGCKVKINTSKDFFTDIKEGIVVNKYLSKFDYSNMVCIFIKEDNEIYFKDIKHITEIMGHDIMLNDVLEWLNHIIYEKCIPINDLGYSGMVKHFYIKGDDGSIIFEILDLKNPELGLDMIRGGFWNLFSPYLKDQSEELIKFLYDLKQEIYENE